MPADASQQSAAATSGQISSMQQYGAGGEGQQGEQYDSIFSIMLGKSPQIQSFSLSNIGISKAFMASGGGMFDSLNPSSAKTMGKFFEGLDFDFEVAPAGADQPQPDGQDPMQGQEMQQGGQDPNMYDPNQQNMQGDYGQGMQGYQQEMPYGYGDQYGQQQQAMGMGGDMGQQQGGGGAPFGYGQEPGDDYGMFNAGQEERGVHDFDAFAASGQAGSGNQTNIDSFIQGGSGSRRKKSTKSSGGSGGDNGDLVNGASGEDGSDANNDDDDLQARGSNAPSSGPFPSAVGDTSEAGRVSEDTPGAKSPAVSPGQNKGKEGGGVSL